MATRQAANTPAQSAKQTPNQRQMLLLIGGVVVVAVIGFVAAIAISGNANVQALDYSQMNPTRTADGAFIIGNPDAPVTVIEFADFGCPACMSYHGDVQRFITEYVATGQARFEFRIFPTAGGQTTVFAGQVAECVDEAQPGAFWQMYDRYFELSRTGRYFTDDGIRSAVQSVGLNYSEILACSRDATQVTTDINFGTANQVSGTPAVMVRYNNGDAEWIASGGTTFNRGAVPFSVLAAVVQEANS
ncbi:MAG: thioredoxin domain-containing protein [bacterium]|nr:thioredoxin domain-containing protein [bacterium]